MTKVEQLLANLAFREMVNADKTAYAIARLLPGYSTTTIKEARLKFRETDAFKGTSKADKPQPAAPKGKPAASTEFTGDKASFIGYSKDRITTLQQLLDFCEFDGSEWDVKSHKVNKWEVGAKDEKGNLQIADLWQVEARFERKVQAVAARDEIALMLDEAKKGMVEYPPFRRLPSQDQYGNLLLVSIPDLHVGKLAWAKECGDHYDVHIAETVFRNALDALLKRAAPYPVDRILFVVGNDLIHIDNPRNTTYNGTPQDHDSRYMRTFTHARHLMTEAIDRLVTIADVDVMIVPGNHDETAAFHVGQCLECWYHKCPQVNVDITPTLRKYYEWGDCMFMFTHGDKEPIAKLAQLAAFEQKQMWGRTTHREALVGHLHHTEVKDQPGITVRRLCSLSAADAWHKHAGYVGSPRRAESFVWNKQDGLIGSQVYTVPTPANDTPI